MEEISNPHLSLIKSLTETSSSLFRSGSSSLKTEKKNKLSYISCGDHAEVDVESSAQCKALSKAGSQK